MVLPNTEYPQIHLNRRTVKISLCPGASMPERATESASGFDLHAYTPKDPLIIAPGKYCRVRTGVKLAFPSPLSTPGYRLGASVRPRSGLMFNSGVIGQYGTIDNDYRGEIMVLLHNTRQNAFCVGHKDRIAQLVIEFIPVLPELSLVLPEDFPADTPRGTNGFGSTGV